MAGACLQSGAGPAGDGVHTRSPSLVPASAARLAAETTVFRISYLPLQMFNTHPATAEG